MRIHAIAALGLLAATLSAGGALAGAVPDSIARAALQQQIGRLGKVRLLGPAGETLVRRPVVREDGLHMREPYRVPRRAVIVVGDVPAPPPPVDFVPWSEIDEVQVPRGAPGRGALAGALVGAGVSAVLVTIVRAAGPENEGTLTTLAVAVVGACAAVGGVIGAHSENWQAVYPELPPPPHP